MNSLFTIVSAALNRLRVLQLAVMLTSYISFHNHSSFVQLAHPERVQRTWQRVAGKGKEAKQQLLHKVPGALEGAVWRLLPLHNL